jgi:predicted TIM-barrel fold metal-dependent hydrolase
LISDSSLAQAFWVHGSTPACPIYDMHGHMGAWGGIYFPRPSPDAMIETMNECGVRMLVFSHHEALMAPDVGNRAAVRAVRRFPERLRAYCVVNPNYPDRAADDLAAYGDHADVFVGLKFLPDYHGLPLTHKHYRRAWEFANERKLLVLTHTWSGSALDGPGVVDEVATCYPQVSLLLGHSFHDDWDAAVRAAQRFPNVYLELTAVFDDRGAIEHLVRGAGSDRLLFGTDLPWFDPHHGVGALLSAAITDEDRHNICHRNAERLLAPSIGAVSE